MKYRPWFLASVVVALAATFLAWWWLPEGRIPTHFGAGGGPDDWGTRTSLIGVLVPVTVGLALLMGWLTARTPTMDWVYLNVPHKPYWSRPENEARARERLQEDGYLIGAWTMGLMAVVPIAAARSVHSVAETGRTGWEDLAVVVVALLGLLTLVVVRQRWYRKNREA